MDASTDKLHDKSGDHKQNLNLTVTTEDLVLLDPEEPSPHTLLEEFERMFSIGVTSAPPGSPVNNSSTASSTETTPMGFSWRIIGEMEQFDPNGGEDEDTRIVTFRVPENIERELSSGDQKMAEEQVLAQVQSDEVEKAKNSKLKT